VKADVRIYTTIPVFIFEISVLKRLTENTAKEFKQTVYSSCNTDMNQSVLSVLLRTLNSDR